ncbi:uncharacterized protein LOC116349142, partial [Contarinia nasturtii]|uniref:uncharacterized protein LOC116349142 n=1 Tax=Contarinia nasturtii TaxID=265458 RepID=UPI0012D40E21
NPNSVTNQGNNDSTFNQFLQSQQQQQQQTNQNQNQSGGNQETTTVNPAIAQLKLSSPYINCPTLSQYDPVCGSDNQIYGNAEKLQCANNCGRLLTPNWDVFEKAQMNRSGEKVALIFLQIILHQESDKRGFKLITDTLLEVNPAIIEISSQFAGFLLNCLLSGAFKKRGNKSSN